MDDDLDLQQAVEIEEAAPRTLLIRVRGDLDDETTAELRAALDRELADAPVLLLLVDLGRVTLLGPAGRRMLLELRRRCRVEDRHLVLIGTACPAVHRPLRMSGLLPLFDTQLTVQAALHRRFGAPRPAAPRPLAPHRR